MGVYLDKYRSTLPETQARQITSLLNQEKESGKIKTLEEYKVRLAALTTELQEQLLVPTLKLYPAVSGEIIDSETFNFMIERIVDDFTAGFTEAMNISEIMDLHDNLVTDVVFRSINLALNELDARVSLYEFLSGNQNGFDDAQFNTFKGTEIGNTSRTHNNAALIYGDPAVKDLISVSQDAAVDLFGERLTLGPNNEKTVLVKSIRQIFDASAPQSELNAALDSKNEDIRNIIDGRNGTYWLYSVLLTTSPTDQSFVLAVQLLSLSSNCLPLRKLILSL